MTHKLFTLPVCLLMAASLVAQEKPFVITGQIKGKKEGYIYLTYRPLEKYDSAKIVNGRFVFKGKLDGPAEASLLMDKSPRSFEKYTQVYITPGTMQLTVDYNNFSEGIVLKGSPVQADADLLKRLIAPVMIKLKPISDSFSHANDVYIAAIRAKKDEATLDQLKNEADAIKERMEPYQEQIGDIQEKFMDTHPTSFVTASMLRYKIGGMPVQEGEARYEKLTAHTKNSSLGKEIKEELDGLRAGSPGAKAFVFTAQELRGAPLSLADYKGKYVLLDFWASWCVPCRKSNPHLKELYAKYSGKGFEIIGVSDDDNHEDAWKKAVEKDGVGIWKHVLRGFDLQKLLKKEKNVNDISNYYGIHSLPTKILVGPDGVIVGRYGGGGEDDDAMDAKLKEIFGS